MELTVDELYSYLQCPLKYRFSHIEKLPDKSDYKNSQLFSTGIHKVITWFYYQVQNGTMPTVRQLRDKWASYYYEIFEGDKRTKENFLAPRTRIDNQRITQLLNRGYETIYAFYAENKDDPGIPIAVNYPFRIAFDDNLIIKSEFELIREKVDKKLQTRFIEIVDFKTNGYTKDSTDGFFLRHDLRATLMYYAFQQQFKSTPDRFVFDYIGTPHTIMLQRNENEINRLKSVLKGVSNGIKNEDFYPRQSFSCKTCSMREYCDRLKF